MSRPPLQPHVPGNGLRLGCAWTLGGHLQGTPQKPWDAQNRAAPTGWQHPVLCHAVPNPGTAQPCTRAEQQVGALGLVPVGDFQGQESHRKSLNLQIPDSLGSLSPGAKKGDYGWEWDIPTATAGGGILWGPTALGALRGCLNCPD